MIALVSDAGGASKLNRLRQRTEDDDIRARAGRILQAFFGSADAIAEFGRCTVVGPPKEAA